MPRVELLPAQPEHQPVLANLFQLYAHDFSEFLPLELLEDGRFDCPPLAPYWSEPGLHPFLVRVDGKLAGFVLVKKDADAWDMAEFFIVRAYRRLGVGARVAHQVWSRFPGAWRIRVRLANASALKFWAASIEASVGRPVTPANIETSGHPWRVFSFTI